VALSAYFLKGVVPEWDLKDIYYGMMQFMVIQVIGLVLIIIPIILPLIEALEFNLTWFAILVAVNLQTAWLSPPVALSAYFLKGVVPEWDLKDIYYGMMQFMVIQVIGLILIIVFPQIALWLPAYLYGQ
jgi:TRAP-type mannitol/chloroaromatic compound transport system permease large subunit